MECEILFNYYDLPKLICSTKETSDTKEYLEDFIERKIMKTELLADIEKLDEEDISFYDACMLINTIKGFTKDYTVVLNSVNELIGNINKTINEKESEISYLNSKLSRLNIGNDIDIEIITYLQPLVKISEYSIEKEYNEFIDQLNIKHTEESIDFSSFPILTAKK